MEEIFVWCNALQCRVAVEDKDKRFCNLGRILNIIITSINKYQSLQIAYYDNLPGIQYGKCSLWRLKTADRLTNWRES